MKIRSNSSSINSIRRKRMFATITRSVPVVLLALAALAGPARAETLTADMNLNPRVLHIGEPAELKFTIRGMENPPPPPLSAIKGLQIRGPSVGTTFSSSVVNGRVTTDRATIYTYQVFPLESGTFQLGPYRYIADGNAVALPAIELRVVSAGKSANSGQHSGQKTIFARLIADKDKLYNQEIFDLIFEIYTTGDVNIGRDIEILNMPTTGLSLQPFEILAPDRRVVDNEVYNVRRFRSKAHALTAGTFTLAPTLRVPVVMPRQQRRRNLMDDPFFSMFGNTRTQPVDVSPEPLTLNIEQLPEAGKPDDFSGAVGEFMFDVEVKPTELEVGEPITVSMIISGSGNIENALPPPFPESEYFKSYEASRIESDINQQTAIGRKVFEQVVIPKTDAVKEFPALVFNYFDPQDNSYKTIKEGPFPLTVHKTSKQQAQFLRPTAAANETEAEVLGTDLIYLKPEPKSWAKTVTPPPLYRSPLFALGIAVPPVLLAGLYLLLRRKRDLQQNQAKARRLRAPKRARNGIHKAQQAIRTSDTDAFYEGIWDALCAYFGDRMNLAPGEVTPATVLSFCQPLPQDELLFLKYIFAACEQHRFSGGSAADSSAQSQQDDLKKLQSILKSVERIKR